jgi:glutamine phosphoribosylpyrophosphate amidotransferase
LSIDGMVKATNQALGSLCLACFNGDYPVNIPPGANKEAMERPRHSLAPEESPQAELFGNLR